MALDTINVIYAEEMETHIVSTVPDMAIWIVTYVMGLGNTVATIAEEKGAIVAAHVLAMVILIVRDAMVAEEYGISMEESFIVTNAEDMENSNANLVEGRKHLPVTIVKGMAITYAQNAMDMEKAHAIIATDQGIQVVQYVKERGKLHVIIAMVMA
jgi:hypothetical protein